MNLKTFARLVLYFANNTSARLYKTKLNKLLFYTQFLYYNKYHEDLLETDFICDYFGPAIEDIDSFLEEVESIGLIKLENTVYGKFINAEYNLLDENYTKEELLILNKVANKFDKFSASQISEYSHDEPLWINTNIKEIIPLESANELNEF